MGEDLPPIETLFFVETDTPVDEVTHVRTNIYRLGDNHLPRQNLLSEPLQVVLGELPRDLPDHHLIHDHSQRPYVALVCVPFLLQDLRSHVGRGPHQRLQKTASARQILGKTKITNFKSIVTDEDVVRFQVAMDHAIHHQLSEPVEDLDEAVHGQLFIKRRIGLELLAKRTLCLFQNDIKVVLGFVDIDEFDDVWTFESLHDLDLREKGILGVLILLDHSLRDHLDGHLFPSILNDPPIDDRKGALPQLIVHVDDISADSLLIAHLINIKISSLENKNK